jgi:hypothetical protein
MGFGTYETSETQGSKLELYKFETDDGLQSWYYTTDATTWNLLGQDWVPEVISRGDLQQGSGEESAQRLTITVPWDNPVAVLHIPYLPPRPVKVTIYSIQRRDMTQEMVQVFVGYVTNFALRSQSAEVELQCSQIIDSMNQNVPFATHQSGCVWTTYEAGCGLNRELFKTVVTGPLVIDGLTISSPLIGALGDNWFRAGVAENPATGEVRFVTAQVGDVATLDAPFVTLDTDSTLYFYAGDDYLPETCRLKFNNKINYLGFDFQPHYNVFEKGVDGKETVIGGDGIFRGFKPPGS